MACENHVKNKNSNILILGTKATINSKTYENFLHKFNFKNLQVKATGLFVPLVEEDIYSGEILEATFRHYFKDLTNPHAIILGCTHFPLISNELQNYFGHDTKLIHSGDAIVEYLESKFKFSQKYKKPKLKFFASENPEALRSVATKWLDL